MICHDARHLEGFWNLATISRHPELSARGFAGTEFASFVMTCFVAFSKITVWTNPRTT
jgi:hypothetical protein